MTLSRNLTFVAILLAISLESNVGLQGATFDGHQGGGGEVVSWPAPTGEKLFEDYTLRVNGQAVPVYSCRVSAMPFNQVWPGYQRPLDQTELAGFAYWNMPGPVRVEVISKRSFKSVAVRPSSRGIQPVTKGQQITFQLARPGQFTVELDGPHHTLHLFADPPEADAPKPDDPNVLYFGPGVHRPGDIQLKSGQTVYVAGGAIVYTTIEGLGVSGVRILGRGIIDSSEVQRYRGDVRGDSNLIPGVTKGSIWLWGCSDVKVDGVILRDPPFWCLTTLGCRNVAISDVKLIGFWRYNSDGIDICNSQNVTISHSFVRTFDDSIVVDGRGYGVPISKVLKRNEEMYDHLPERHIRVSDLVVWCDWGRSLEIGALTFAPEITDVVFRDIDIIRSTHIAMDIQHSNRAAVNNIRYENIRVEVDDFNPLPVLQKQRDEKYQPNPPAGGFVPELFVIIIAHNK
jgi:hypothetical protein